MPPFKMPEQCEKCDEPGVGYNDDGRWLCEDCLFEWACEEVMPDVVGDEDAQ